MAESDYADRVERAQSGTDARELPEKVAREVIKDVEQASAALQLCNVHRMSTRQEKLTLLDSFPNAYWLSGTVDYPVLGGDNDSGSQRAKDSQPKRTTKVTWNTKSLAAEELAVLVPIPDNYVDDTGAPLFEEIRPMVATAFAKKIDDAILWGVDSPFVQNGVIEGAISNGNVIILGSTPAPADDLAGDIATLGFEAAQEGVKVDKFVTGPGFDWRLYNLRATDGTPIYVPPTETSPGRVYGRSLNEVTNGTWDDEVALLVGGEWQYARVGIRQDITFSLSSDAVIFDPATQKVVYSAFQQDGKVLRAVMRLAYTVVQPLRHLTGTKVYPFWALQDNTLS
jgi:HK97 family phage major capsid protein